MKELLESVLKHANNVIGNGGESTESVVLKDAVDHFSQEVMKCGTDSGKMKSIFTKNAVRVQAITDAVEKGTALTEKVQVPIWKADAVVTKSDDVGVALAKALETLSKVAGGTTAAATAAASTEDPVIKCKECLWEGKTSVMKSGVCPECGEVLKSDTSTAKTGFEKAKESLLQLVEVGGDDEVLKGLKAKCEQLQKTDKGSKDDSLTKAATKIDLLLKGEEIEDGWPRDMHDVVAKDDVEDKDWLNS